MKNKIPFLFIPLTLVSVQQLDKKQLNYIQYFFILCAVVSSGWSYIQYLQNIELYTNLYTKGEVIPTLIHHVSLAVLLVITVLFVLNNLLKVISKIEKIIHIFLLIWFVYFIHILSVRTGIVLVYLSLFLVVFSLLIIHKKPLFAISLIGLMIISAYISYEKVPTIKSKITYTLYGISQYKNQQDTSNQVSDSRRLLSDKIGWELLQKNKWMGVGMGDIQDEMNVIYKQRYPQFKPDVYAHIHNQYLYTTTGIGIISGILFCVFLLLPFLLFIKEKKLTFIIAYLLLLLVMCWEPFIENQLGTSIFLVVCSLGFVSKKEV